MQIEWSPGRNDEHMNGLTSTTEPAEPLGAGVTSIIDPAPIDSAPDGPASDGPASSDTASSDTVKVVASDVDDGMPATHVDAARGNYVDTSPETDAASDDGMAGEEEVHRSEVDAVDRLLDEVELAMARLDDGTYGRCETCGVPINDVELAAGPLVRECTPCSAGALAFEDA
jgi:DnaK suppressor protein